MVAWGPVGKRLARLAAREGPRAVRAWQQRQGGASSPPRSSSAEPAEAPRPGRPPLSAATGAVPRTISYAPDLDGAADPGEVVWTWVPYEEGDGRGKDRPVLVVGRDGDDVLALQLTSRDHDGDRAWHALGAGAWDGEHRASWVRLDRVLQVDADGIRREGAVLRRDRFDAVADRLRGEHGWR